MAESAIAQRRREWKRFGLHRIRVALQSMGFTATRSSLRTDVLAAIRLMWPVGTEHTLIRVGDEFDGGYLVPDDLVGIRACFSPGVSDVANFERDLALRGIPSFMADASVASSPLENELLHFEPLWLGSADNAATQTISLDTWVATRAPVSDSNTGDLLLQMDIEDAEWSTLAAASDETLRRFRIMVIEFHDLESLSTRKGLEYMGAIFRRLDHLFCVVHAHPNNTQKVVVINGVAIHPVMEFTLLRRDRITKQKSAGPFPHPLDAPNDPGKPNVSLHKGWHGKAGISVN